MGMEIKTFNYMELARQIVDGPKWPKKDEQGLSPQEYVDRRIAELRWLAKSPDHQILAVLLEQEIASDIRYTLSRKEPIEPLLYALRTCNPFHAPIARSLSAEKIESFRHVIPGSAAFEMFDENQQWYATQMLDGPRTKLTITPKNVTLNTGVENIDHTIRSSSFPIAQYFYAIHVAPECFPDYVQNIARHATGVEQVKNSANSKTIRKTIAEKMASGEYPEPIDVNVAMSNNLTLLADWIKPRDTQLAVAYVKGKRDVAWLEQYAPASVILSKMTEGLAEKGFHQKWGGTFPLLIMDLCEHLKDSHRELATVALWDLAAAMASDKVLGFEGAEESVNRIAHLAKTLTPGEKASSKGVLAMKLIGHKLGIESSEAVIAFIAEQRMEKIVGPIMDKLYPNVVERAKTLQSFGMRSNSPAMLREKGRALMDDLGM